MVDASYSRASLHHVFHILPAKECSDLRIAMSDLGGTPPMSVEIHVVSDPMVVSRIRLGVRNKERVLCAVCNYQYYPGDPEGVWLRHDAPQPQEWFHLSTPRRSDRVRDVRSTVRFGLAVLQLLESGDITPRKLS